MKKLIVIAALVAVVLGGVSNAFAWYNENYSTGQETYYQPNLNGGFNVSNASGYESTFNPTVDGNTYSQGF